MSRTALLLALLTTVLLAPSAEAARFRGTGYSVFDRGGRELFPARGLIAAPSGGALVGLTVGAGDDQLMGVLRIDSRGRRVRSFGRRGLATARAGSGWTEDTASLLRFPDGRVVVTGTSAGPVPRGAQPRMGIGLAQLTASGGPDTAVSSNGVARHEIEDGDLLPNFIVPRPGGGVVVGSMGFLPTAHACATALTATLAIDPGYDAKCIVPPGTTSAYYVDGSALPDGSIVAGLAATQFGGDPDGEPGLAYGVGKILPTGAIDTSFGTNGFSFTPVGTALCEDERPDARRLAPRSGGGWIVAGGVGCATGLVAFTATGQPDQSFGTGGRVTTDLDPTRGHELMTGLIALADGGFAAVAQRFTRGSNLLVARWKADGSLDRSFDGDGRLRLKIRRALSGYAGGFSGGIMPRPNGGLLVTASVAAGGDTADDEELAVIALTRSGKLDKSFGVGSVNLR